MKLRPVLLASLVFTATALVWPSGTSIAQEGDPWCPEVLPEPVPEEGLPDPFWLPVAAPGTNFVSDVAVEGDRVLAAGLTGGPMPGDAWLSTDGGTSWERGAGIPGGVSAVALDPNEPAAMYAAAGASFFRSPDAGSRWCLMGSLRAPVRQIAVDARTPGRVLAGLSDGGVARSDDGGRTWTTSGEGLPSGRIITGIVTGATADAVLVATEDGAYRSTDGGRTFVPANAGIQGWDPLGTGSRVLSSLARDPSSPGTVVAVQPPGPYLATHCLYLNSIYGYCAAGRVYRSTDFGASWTEVPEPVLPTNATRLGGFKCLRGLYAAAVTRSGAIVAGGACGLWVTRDVGANWVRFDDVPGSARILKVEVGRGDDVWALSDGQGVFRSRDDAISFARVPALGWPGGGQVDGGNVCWMEPLGGGRILASCGPNRVRGGLHTVRSEDGGATWKAVTGLREGWVVDLERDAVHGNVVLAATKAEGFFRSTDHGATWQPISALPASANGLAADPSTSGVFYASAALATPVGLTPIWGEHVSGGLWKTRDGGATWSLVGALPNAIPYELAVAPWDPKVLFLAGWTESISATPSGGLWRSDDGGVNWIPVGSVPANRATNAIGFVAGAPGVVLVSSDTVYRSADGGRTFARLSGLPGNQWAFPRSFATNTGAPGVVYYGTDAELLRSEDAGLTWSAHDAGLEAQTLTGMRAVFADPDDPRGFFVLAGGYGWSWATRFGSYGKYLLHGREA